MGFDNVVKEVLMWEGGFSDHPADSGGATMYGITEAVARDFGYQGDMRDLPLDVAKEIYRDRYWDRIRAGDFENEKLQLMLMDTAVNMGVRTAVIMLQDMYNMISGEDISVDGVVGPQTLSHINGYGRQDNLLFAYQIRRGERYFNIVRRDKSQRAFIHGWLNRLRAVYRGEAVFVEKGQDMTVKRALEFLLDSLIDKILLKGS